MIKTICVVSFIPFGCLIVDLPPIFFAHAMIYNPAIFDFLTYCTCSSWKACPLFCQFSRYADRKSMFDLQRVHPFFSPLPDRTSCAILYSHWSRHCGEWLKAVGSVIKHGPGSYPAGGNLFLWASNWFVYFFASATWLYDRRPVLCPGVLVLLISTELIDQF